MSFELSFDLSNSIFPSRSFVIISEHEAGLPDVRFWISASP